MCKVSFKQFEFNGIYFYVYFVQYFEDYVVDIGMLVEQDIFKDICIFLLLVEKSEEVVKGMEFKFVVDKVVVSSSDYL